MLVEFKVTISEVIAEARAGTVFGLICINNKHLIQIQSTSTNPCSCDGQGLDCELELVEGSLRGRRQGSLEFSNGSLSDVDGSVYELT